MKIRKRTLLRLYLFFIPDLVILFFLIISFYSMEFEKIVLDLLFLLIFILICLRVIVFFILSKNYYKNRFNTLIGILTDFKKGKYFVSKKEIKGDDEFAIVLKELITIGKHIDNIITSQKIEIDKFYELYNSLIFSMSSYFVVLGGEDKIVFATEGFWKKFRFEQDDITGKKIDDIFYFLNARLIGGIYQSRKLGKSVYLEKIHLLSQNKISIIADIKISNINIQGENQIIIIIDDITSKLRKDYQLTLMSQISESIQKNVEIDRVLYSILTGVTSGSGLGFNRSMLFLVDKDHENLVGKMAVGPDSFEEAIEVWSSAAPTIAITDQIEDLEIKSGADLLNKILNLRFQIVDNEKNIFIQSFTKKEEIHIFDSWDDERVDDKIRELMDVKEFVIVPLIVGNKSIGIIIADNKFNQSPIGNDSIELLTIFASQAALSIESYSSLEIIRNEMEKINERQEAMLESEKLAAVGRVASHISHEIRNPLVTMGGYARRIMQLSKDLKNEGISSAANIILKESERLEKTLSNVMDFTRPTKYIKDFNNVNEVVGDTLDLLKNVLLEKKIKVEMNLDPELPLIKSDFNQLKQVMLNLLQNSMDSISGKGKILIDTEIVDDFIILSIADNGSGIEHNDPNSIFEPFYTTKVTGVGLGLAIVKKIIKDHNGEIEVKKGDVAGVKFCIKLPLPA